MNRTLTTIVIFCVLLLMGMRSNASDASAQGESSTDGGNSSKQGAEEPVYTVKQLKALSAQSGAQYLVKGYIVDIIDCPPCPEDAVCPTCPGEYIIISDSPHKGKTDEQKSKELWVSTMMKGQRDFKKWIKYRFTLKADDETLPSWDKAAYELWDMEKFAVTKPSGQSAP